MEIEAHLNKPYVKLDKENCTLTLKGKSYPEHPSTFYNPILEELEKCSEYMEGAVITIDLALEIMNSVSTKYIYHMLKTINESAKNLIINWYYEEDDEDMKEEAQLFQGAFPNSEFKIICVEDLMKV
jgi:hypothetical protein